MGLLIKINYFRAESDNVRVSLVGDGTLRITKVAIEDAGDWTCYNDETNYTGLHSNIVLYIYL